MSITLADPRAHIEAPPDPRTDALRQRVKDLRSDALPYAAMAREAGIAGATFNLWLNAAYAGNNERVTVQVERWLENRQEAQRLRQGLPAEPGFVVTPTIRRILDLLGYAQAAPTMAVVSGGAGVGKTSAVEHYARSNPNVWVMVGEPACRSPNAMLARLAEVLGMGGSLRSRAVVQRLTGTGGQLILDEAHHYPTPVLDQVRYIHDQAGIGIALLGNGGIYGRLEGAGRTERYAPLFRRVGMRLTLPRTTARDVAALLDAWGVEGRDERRLLGAVAGQPGALGGMAQVLRMAHMLAEGSQVTALHIREAHLRLREVPIEGDAS
jgi:DNA transposition AAA+ family ATPase